MSNVSFKEVIMDDRSGNIENVILVDNHTEQIFKVKTRAVVDFRARIIENDEKLLQGKECFY